MKDIDFDELDRAVSSVLSKSTPSDNPTSVSVEQPVPAPIAQVSTPVTPPASKNDDAPTEQFTTPGVAETPVVTSSPIALRSRGKFMDVMHPSSDMNPAAPKSDRPAFAPPRTLAPLTPRDTIQPESTTTVDESSALIGAEEPASVDDAPLAPTLTNKEDEEMLLLEAETEDEPTEVQGETLGESITEASTDYVDPLDVAAKNIEVAPVESQHQEDTSQPTPFLSDTKVDKRPLGAFGESDEQDVQTAEPTTDDTQTVPVVPLPRELQSDVVQVESAQETDPSASEQQAMPYTSPVGVAPVDTDDGRVEGHPLFDTSTYHEPIAAVQAKKTAPWVFWSVGLGVCLLIGAGVGYFLFTAGL